MSNIQSSGEFMAILAAWQALTVTLHEAHIIDRPTLAGMVSRIGRGFQGLDGFDLSDEEEARFKLSIRELANLDWRNVKP